MIINVLEITLQAAAVGAGAGAGSPRNIALLEQVVKLTPVKYTTLRV